MTRRMFPCPNVSDELPIRLRAYVESAQKDPSKLRRSGRQQLQSASDWSLVFDTETTTDPGQSLRIGFCRVYHRNELRRHVLFYADDLKGNDLSVVKRYAKPGLEIMPREEFIDTIFYKYGYHLRAMIVGFNLPFDLSRLAVSHASARGTMRGGFSLKLSPLNYQPPVQIKHLSKYLSMMRFAAPFVSPNSRSQLKHGKKNPHKRGYFLEVRALAAALLSRSFSLASLAEFLGVAHGKLETDYHGKPLTKEYLEYAERDVLTTWECSRELCRRYETLALKSTPVHRIFSEASIGKAYFSEMAIEPWFNVQRDIPRKLLAQILSAYFGGRSEVRIRRELRQVVLCDFLSMYPTVCTLTGLWPYVIGKSMQWRDGTVQVTRILKTWTLRDLQDKANWPKLVALVQVMPDADIFPVRAEYNDGADGTIGANYLSSNKGLWFTLADCLASQLLADKPVHVIQALIFKPGPPQPGLKSVAISGNADYLVDPYKDDFYQRMIELRQAVKTKRDASTGGTFVKLDVEQNALKIATNATSYGIFAEINVNDRAKKAGSRVHAAVSSSYIVEHIKDEQPGRYFHPLLAATITGTARLMLAIAERLILDQGLEWAFCDTDSMAIAKPQDMSEAKFHKKVDHIVAWFSRLNPYRFSGSILKIEDVNCSLENPKKRQPLFVWAVSAKRYALFNVENIQPVIRKASAHGLGHLQTPYNKSTPAKGIPAPRGKFEKIGVEHWHHDLWWLIVKAALDGHPDDVKFNHHPALKKPAASRYAATTPKYLRWFDEYNDGLPYARKLKPFGFVSAFSARPLVEKPLPKSKRSNSKTNSQPKPVAPFDKNPVVAAQNAFDRITREPVPVEDLKTYQQGLAQYHLHPEDKFLNGDFLDRGTTLRRHVRVTEIEYIGKESNKWEDQYHFGFDADEEIRYGSRPTDAGSLLKTIRAIVETHGLRKTAQQLGVSRAKLSGLLENELAGCTTAFLQRISRIIAAINSRLDQENERNSALLSIVNREIKKIGFSEFSRSVGCDPSNLRKALLGERQLGMMAGKMRRYFSID
jgi:predicted transcriptional regulator with HTH domain